MSGVTFSSFEDRKKFDLQLDQALVDQERLACIFEHADIRKIELKSESYQWEQTGNICIEFEHDGKPSGIAVTESGMWVHELKRNGEPLVYLMFPVTRLKLLVEEAKRNGRTREGAGDGGRSKVALIRLKDILK